MKHCPNCLIDYNFELRFCPKCGKATQASSNNPAGDIADKHAPKGDSPASNVTSHMDGFFNSNPRQVEPSPDAKDFAGTVNPKQDTESVKDSEPSPPPPSPFYLDINPELLRSVRNLSRTIVISNVVMILGIIGLALSFNSSQRGVQASLTAMAEKSGAATEVTKAYVEQLKATQEKFVAEMTSWRDGVTQQVSNTTKATAEIQERMTKIDEQLVAYRFATMPVKQKESIFKAAHRKLDSISGTTKGKTAKRAIDDFRGSLSSKEPLKVIREFDRIAPKLDKQTRTKIETDVLGLMTAD